MSILNYWPDPSKTPRESQIKALEWLEKQTAKYLFIQSPVGTGKSLCGVTYSRFLTQGTGNSFILTPQKILQKQYEDDFLANPNVNLFSFYGKSNYPCVSRNTNCAIGGLMKPKCDNCTHKIAKQKASASSNLVLNYDLALLQFNHQKDFSKRELLICDEGHSLEQILTEFDAIHITRTRMEQVRIKWKLITDIQEAYDWVIDTYLPALDAHVSNLEMEVEPLLQEKHLTPDDIHKIREFNELVEHQAKVTEIHSISSEEMKRYWVLVHDKLNLKFKKLRANTLFTRYLGHMANRVIIMSATLPNHEKLCEDLGIPINESAYFSIDSDFPKQNRRVIHVPYMKMNYDWNKPENEKARKEYIEGVEVICGLHKEEKGIIHTANYTVSEWLVERINTTHQIFHHNPDSGDDRNSVIKAFIECKKPSILISPSITEGLDLKYDLSRFQIIAKTPYPYLGDQWVKARMDLSLEWYQRQAIIQVLQACGRIVRANDDYGTTYIMDGSWPYLYKSTYKYIPKWWHQAYSVM